MKYNNFLVIIALCINLSSTMSLAQQTGGWGNYATAALSTAQHYGGKFLNIGSDLFKNISTPIFNKMSSWGPKAIIAVVTTGLFILMFRYGKETVEQVTTAIINPEKYLTNELKKHNYSPAIIQEKLSLYDKNFTGNSENYYIGILKTVIIDHYKKELFHNDLQVKSYFENPIAMLSSIEKKNIPLYPLNQKLETIDNITIDNKTKNFINNCYFFAITNIVNHIKSDAYYIAFKKRTAEQPLLLKWHNEWHNKF